jgi:hypothetical protein
MVRFLSQRGEGCKMLVLVLATDPDENKAARVRKQVGYVQILGSRNSPMDSKEMPELPEPALPRRSRIGQAMRRALAKHWGKILATWVVWTVGLASIIYLRVRPTYESSSLLRVEPATTNLFGVVGDEPEAFDHFLQTQVELIKSPSVVSTAIASGPKVTGTALLRGSRDPESELRARLQVGVLRGTYLIRVGLTTPEPADGPAILSEVVQAYLALANAWSSEKNASQIKRLEKYSLELSAIIDEKQNEWIQIAQKGIVGLRASPAVAASPTAPLAPAGSDDSSLSVAVPRRVSMDEYRQIRQRFFETTLKLFETEALRKRREVQLSVREAGEEDPSLHDLNDQIGSLVVLKSAYEKLLSQLQFVNEQDGADSVKLALVREDLASFRQMHSSVEKRIEQLKFDAPGEARINEIDPAKPNAIPIKDDRRKLFVLAPIVVFALVLVLFLGLALLSGRGTDRDELVPSA